MTARPAVLTAPPTYTPPTPDQRLAATGAPADIASRILPDGTPIPLEILEDMAAQQVPWTLLQSLLARGHIRDVADLRGLLVLWDGDDALVRAWASLGSFAQAYRLDVLGISPAVARRLNAHSGQDLAALHALVKAARTAGMRTEDLLLWRAGGVLTTSHPFIDRETFAAWRRVGTQRIGMARAAVACGAGLSPAEAAAQWRAGTFDETSLRGLATLRL
jgi:hypothetical protein